MCLTSKTNKHVFILFTTTPYNKMIQKIRNSTEPLFIIVAKLKNFASRSAQYFSLVNTLLIITTFFAVKNIKINFYLLITLLVGLVIVVGVLDYFLVLKHEIAHMNSQNNIKQDTQKIIKELEEQKNELRRISKRFNTKL